jgi:hypothetical protein
MDPAVHTGERMPTRSDIATIISKITWNTQNARPACC